MSWDRSFTAAVLFVFGFLPLVRELRTRDRGRLPAGVVGPEQDESRLKYTPLRGNTLRRTLQSEILDGADVPDHLVDRAYRDLAKIHNVLGDTAAVVAAMRRDPLPIRRILDIGCARGGVLREVRQRLGVEVIGIDLRVPKIPENDLRIIRANAILDPLPAADVAFSMSLSHHLCEGDLIALIRNVGRSCRRFFILDLVRHPLPLALFRVFVAPLVSRIAAIDGQISVRRSYTPAECRNTVGEALAGSGAVFQHSVHPFYIRQTVDICYARRAGNDDTMQAIGPLPLACGD